MARSFFDANKDLFEYEKLVGTDDPVALSLRDGIGAKTFLDKYRECEQRQALELRANLPIPLATALAVNTAVRTHASQQLLQRVSFTTVLPPPPASVPLAFQESAPLAPIASRTRSRLENNLRQSALSSNYEEDGAQGTTQWQSDRVQASLERPSPTKPPLSSSSVVEVPTNASVRSLEYTPPTLSSLLVDSATRSAVLRHRHLDEAKKVELLLGTSCGGRISAASTNLPPSVRRRLQAAAKLEQRRERLYAALHKHFQSLLIVCVRGGDANTGIR